MNVSGQNFNLTPSDNVGRFIMHAGTTHLGSGVTVGRLDLIENAIGTTTQTGNITERRPGGGRKLADARREI